MTHLKRVNVINSVTGVAYRATRYKASQLTDEGFHYTTKSKLKSLMKENQKSANRRANKGVTVEEILNERRNRRRPFKYRLKDMVKKFFNKEEK